MSDAEASEVSFSKGDRVKLSAEGVAAEMRRIYGNRAPLDRAGTIVGMSRAGTEARLVWDGTKSEQYALVRHLELIEDR